MNTPVEDIKAKLNIVDVVGAYVRLQKAGTYWKALCPFHNEKTPSFTVSEERQMWHCFGCNKGGDMFSFLMEIESLDFREALKILADKAGVEFPKYLKDQDSGPKNRSFEILELATKFYEKQLWDGVGKKTSLPYLHDRGLNDEYIRNFRLGYAPDGWRNILDFLKGRGYSEEEIEKTGLVIKKDGGGYYDRFRDRIMFPVRDVLGRVIGYSARIMPGSDESQAKYINTPETEVYRKSQALYGIDCAKQALKRSNFALLVEGQMDVIASHQIGFDMTLAVSGTALTPDQLRLIKRYTDRLKLFFDMDGAGQKAARRSAELAFREGFSVSVVSIAGGKDAAEIARERPEVLRAAVDRDIPAIRYFLDRECLAHDRKTPEGKREIASGIVPLIGAIAHDIDRGFWTRAVAEALDVDESVVMSMLARTLSDSSDRERLSLGVSMRGENETSSVANVFDRRADVLRRKLCALMMADATVWRFMTGDIPRNVASFMRKSRAFATLADRGEACRYDIDAFLSALHRDADQIEWTKLCFEGASMAEGMTFVGESERQAFFTKIAEHSLRELRKELHGDDMTRLERDMREAHERGDKETEHRLLEALSVLMRQENDF
jgi:DNA primase